MEAQRLFQHGERNAGVLMAAGKKAFREDESAQLDYFEIVDPDSLGPVELVRGTVMVAVAGFAGATRLIDNVVLCGENFPQNVGSQKPDSSGASG